MLSKTIGYSFRPKHSVMPMVAKSFYLFYLMQITSGEIDPGFLTQVTQASLAIAHRAILGTLELEALLTVHAMTSSVRDFISHRQHHPVHASLLRTLNHAERVLIRRASVSHVVHRHHREALIVKKALY